jgi:TRAP transporter 4TM/12TM fusion protein
MAEQTPSAPAQPDDDVQKTLQEVEYTGRHLGPRLAKVVSTIAFVWALFQLWIASPLPSSLWLIDVQKRGIHLAFALLLCYLMFPATRRRSDRRISVYDIVLALVSSGTALYLFIAYRGLVARQGILMTVELAGITIPVEGILGGAGIVLLLEATRRSIGIPLVIVASIFLLYSVLGPEVDILIAAIAGMVFAGSAYQAVKGRNAIALPLFALGGVVLLYAFLGETVQDILAHKGVSLRRLIGYHWLGGEAIFGIPVDVSVSFVFLFVLFGALLERAGAGKYFLDLAFAMVGKYRGGPAKAAILASGMTGAISGSSIANVVTTGTFTIPVMIRTGYTAVKAGAIEVAASTNGQIMPPIMGAAAFIIAEFIGVSYFDVVVAAIIPALTSYIALLYISHLEAMKLGLAGLPKSDIPRFWSTFINGLHYLIPIIVLIYLLMVERWTASSAVFYSIMWMMLIILGAKVFPKRFNHAFLVVPLGLPVLVSTALRWTFGFGIIGATLWGLVVALAIVVAMAFTSWRGDRNVANELREGFTEIYDGMVAGARNMVTIGVAVAAAGIIVGAVSSTGLNNAMVGLIEAISGGNVYILLVMVAVLCLVLGMGLPTTANYIVVASLMAPVVVELGGAAGLVLPLIAVHLFVFYFGLMADSTPPVCLAAFAAAAISRADPLKTGVQSFLYDMRTAVLPFIFIFNPELLLIGVESWWQGVMVFVLSVLAIFCFSSVTQGWLIVKVKWYEAIALLIVMIALFRPDFVMDQFYPPFKSVDMERFAAGEPVATPGYSIRLHITRETDYGDRLKLYRIATPEIPPDPEFGLYGVKLEMSGDGRFEVVDLQPKGLAEQAGTEFGDYVREVDIEQIGLPSKRLTYPFALLLLGLVIAGQLVRKRRAQTGAAAADS